MLLVIMVHFSAVCALYMQCARFTSLPSKILLNDKKYEYMLIVLIILDKIRYIVEHFHL